MKNINVNKFLIYVVLLYVISILLYFLLWIFTKYIFPNLNYDISIELFSFFMSAIFAGGLCFYEKKHRSFLFYIAIFLFIFSIFDLTLFLCVIISSFLTLFIIPIVLSLLIVYIFNKQPIVMGCRIVIGFIFGFIFMIYFSFVFVSAYQGLPQKLYTLNWELFQQYIRLILNLFSKQILFGKFILFTYSILFIKKINSGMPPRSVIVRIQTKIANEVLGVSKATKGYIPSYFFLLTYCCVMISYYIIPDDRNTNLDTIGKMTISAYGLLSIFLAEWAHTLDKKWKRGSYPKYKKPFEIGVITLIIALILGSNIFRYINEVPINKYYPIFSLIIVVLLIISLSLFIKYYDDSIYIQHQ